MIKKQQIKSILGIMILFMCITILQVDANASERTKALAAYKRLLSGKSIVITFPNDYRVIYKSKNTKFAIAYIDGDNVPELVLENYGDAYHCDGYGTIFTYKKGRVVQWKHLAHENEFLYYPKTGIYEDSYVGTGGGAWWLLDINDEEENRLAEYGASYPDITKTEYYVGNKRTSKKNYKKYVRKITKGKKAIDAKFHANTSGNRKKYLK